MRRNGEKRLSETDMKRRVLIVEDSGLTRMEVGDLLRNHFSAEVLEACDGKEGWDVLQSRPDLELIISDIEMPEMNGVELIKAIRSSEEHAFTPILVMTTLDRIKERDDALNAGADAFIEKPVTLEALEALLEDVW